MEKIYRILGKRGRITIPYALRMQMGFRNNDLVSFERDGDTVLVKREKICDSCADDEPEVKNDVNVPLLREFLDALPKEAQKAAFGFLMLRLTGKLPTEQAAK